MWAGQAWALRGPTDQQTEKPGQVLLTPGVRRILGQEQVSEVPVCPKLEDLGSGHSRQRWGQTLLLVGVGFTCHHRTNAQWGKQV